MDFGLSPQQQLVLRLARSRDLRGARRHQILPPLWLIACATLLPLLLLGHPLRWLSLPLVPALGLLQRHRVERRIEDWTLDLRQI